MSSDALRQSLESTLNTHARSRRIGLFVSVNEEVLTGGHRVVLAAVDASGHKVLHREFELSPSDCVNSGPLLQTVLERFLTTLPLEEWTLDSTHNPLSKPVQAERSKEVLKLRLSAQAAGDMELLPLGVSFAGGFVVEFFKKEHGLALDLIFRGFLPQALGQGQFYSLILAGGAGWRYEKNAWLTRFIVRGGAINIRGSQFTENDNSWLPWVELTGAFGRRLGPVVLQLNLSAAPLLYQAQTQNTELRASVSNLRIGLLLEIPFFDHDF